MMVLGLTIPKFDILLLASLEKVIVQNDDLEFPKFDISLQFSLEKVTLKMLIQELALHFQNVDSWIVVSVFIWKRDFPNVNLEVGGNEIRYFASVFTSKSDSQNVDLGPSASKIRYFASVFNYKICFQNDNLGLGPSKIRYFASVFNYKISSKWWFRA